MILKCLVVFALTEIVSGSGEHPRLTVAMVLQKFRHRPKYNRTDPNTGQIFECTKCPRGTVVQIPCTDRYETVCKVCLNGQYMRHNNNLERCHPCMHCGDNAHETMPCDATTRRICQCDTISPCQRFARCTPGYGVLTPGTININSTCEECPSGFFSPKRFSGDRCSAHTNCSDGLMVNVPGNIYHDIMCTSCKKYFDNTACDDALLMFVAHQEIAENKLKMFLRSLTATEDVERLYWEMTGVNRVIMFESLHPLLMKWRETLNGKPVAKTIISILLKADVYNVVRNVKLRFWRGIG